MSDEPALMSLVSVAKAIAGKKLSSREVTQSCLDRIAQWQPRVNAYMAIEAGPLDPFNHSFSIMVECDTQAEIDRLWDALKEGGQIEQCGWVRDRWGLCWQIAPKRLGELMRDPDGDKVKRVAEAMLKMVKLDIAGLEAAARG